MALADGAGNYFAGSGLYLPEQCPAGESAYHKCIEQFGYGFGFTAYMLFLIYFSEGEHKTAHYAICTAFMALGMMLPGMIAGWLQEQLGYEHFFWWVMGCCLITLSDGFPEDRSCIWQKRQTY